MNTNIKLLEKVLREQKNNLGVVPVYIGDDISKKMLDNAIDKYAPGVDSSQVVGLIDTTINGSAKNGIIFTTAGIYGNFFLEKKFSVKYRDIKKLNITGYEKTKNENKYTLEITHTLGNSIETIKIKDTLLGKVTLKLIIEKLMEMEKNGLTDNIDELII